MQDWSLNRKSIHYITQLACYHPVDLMALSLLAIHAPRHPGVSEAICKAYAEAACVCLSRHHEPPETKIGVLCDENWSWQTVLWSKPDDVAQRAWANKDDATRDGAYSVSIAVLEAELGLVAVARAETRTGADYYVGRAESLVDLEKALRLEVSGSDDSSLRELERRLKAKVDQTRRGNSNLPALASVVGFREAKVLLESAD